MAIPQTPPPTAPPVQPDTSGIRGLRTATMVIGLVTAVILLFGGVAGCAVGATFVAVEDFAEEVFDEDLELDDPNDPSYVSTTDDVTNAGIFCDFSLHRPLYRRQDWRE